MKKGLKLGAASLAALMVFGVAGCSVSEKDGKAWAEKNGYVKADDYNLVDSDLDTSATNTGVGGINFGSVKWSDELIKDGVLEYLKGHQLSNGGGYNYREMYQIAISQNNKPKVASVEFQLDYTNGVFTWFGCSEGNTEKLNIMHDNPYASIYWTKQLRNGDAINSYFQSYGVQADVEVVFPNLDTISGQDKTDLVRMAKNYYKGLGYSATLIKAQFPKTEGESDADYAARIATKTLDDVTEDATIAYMKNYSSATQGEYYLLKPTQIVLTSPYLLFMREMTVADTKKYVIATTGADYSEFLSTEFIQKLYTYLRSQTGYENATFTNPVQMKAYATMLGLPSTTVWDGLATQAVLNIG